MAKQYLLILDYPCVEYPIGLFKTAAKALEVASANIPPNLRDLDCIGGDLQDACEHTARRRVDLGVEENRRPNGYTIQEFEDGKPTTWAQVEPYFDRDVVLPKDEDEYDEDEPIDPDQTLAWN